MTAKIIQVFFIIFIGAIEGLTRYLYYLSDIFKRHYIFFKNEKNNLSTSQ